MLDVDKRQFELIAMLDSNTAVRCFVAMNASGRLGSGITTVEYPYEIARWFLQYFWPGSHTLSDDLYHIPGSMR